MTTTLGFISVRGNPVAVRAVVHSWTKSGMHFTALARTHKTRVVINHWTGAENPPDKLFENLRRERKSVHFAVDVTGEVWQYMDTDTYGAHCRAMGANAYSIGIEFICRGNNLGAPTRGILRPRVIDQIHGARLTYDDLSAAQIVVGVALNEALCGAYGLPLRVPERSTGEVSAEVMSARDAAAYTGSAAHLNFEPRKPDCGLTLLRAIRARGRELAGPLGVA